MITISATFIVTITDRLLNRSANEPASGIKNRYGSVNETPPSTSISVFHDASASAFIVPDNLPNCSPTQTDNHRSKLSLNDPKNCVNSTPIKPALHNGRLSSAGSKGRISVLLKVPVPGCDQGRAALSQPRVSGVYGQLPQLDESDSGWSGTVRRSECVSIVIASSSQSSTRNIQVTEKASHLVEL
jgi:hypothetical protein